MMMPAITKLSSTRRLAQPAGRFRLCGARSPLPTALFLLSVVFSLSLAPRLWAQDAVTQSNTSLAALARYERQLEELETRYDSYHPSLLEPLQAMEALLAEQGDHERVAELQNRRLQLLRTSLGFEHPDIIPLLDAMIATQLRLRNWQQVSDYLDHIRYLQSVNHGTDSAVMLHARARQAQWLLNQVFLDREANRPGLVLEARDLLEDALEQAEEAYGEDDPALVPWLYQRALSLYYLVAIMNTDSSIAGRAVDEVARRDGVSRLNSAGRGPVFAPLGFGARNAIPVLEDGEPIGVGYLRQALGFINDIEAIAEAQDDQQLLAMAHIYHGDFHLLMGRASGQRDYAKARDLLVASGVDPARVDRFFSRPMPIPMPRFFASFAELEAYQRGLYQALPGAEDSPGHAGLFVAWDQDLADVALPRPPVDFPALQIETNEAELEFRVSSRGQVASVEVLEVWPGAEQSRDEVERKAWRAARELQFRPAFVDGRNRTTDDARLRYRYYVREER